MWITTSGTTVMSTESTATQPSGPTTVTVYQVVVGGAVVGFAAVELLSSESGTQLKVDPLGPVGDPPKVIVSPRKMV